jgi:hypothetical protein
MSVKAKIGDGGIPPARRARRFKQHVRGAGVTDFLPFLVFLYGAFAGFLIFRLGKQNELRAGEERVLVAAGWAMTALSLTLAAA